MEDWPTFQKVQFQNFLFWIGGGLWKVTQNKCAYLEASLRAALSLNIVECLTSSKSFVRLSQL